MPQRTRSAKDPLDLGVYDRTSIRHLKGRIGAENKGQAGFRLSNDGSSNAYQNVWFRVTLKDAGYLIFLKENNRDQRHYIINVYTDDLEKNRLSHPINLGAGSTSLFNNMIAGTTSDLYNIIDDQSPLPDKNSTSLYPLPKGSYLINITTQRWDIFRYGVYMIIEMPKQTGYLELETFTDESREFVLQEGSTDETPLFIVLEGTVIGVLDNLRERTSRDLREYLDAWSDLTKNTPLPSEITNYLRSTRSIGS